MAKQIFYVNISFLKIIHKEVFRNVNLGNLENVL